MGQTTMTGATNADFKKSWRYRTGLSLFVLGNVGLGIALLVPTLGIPNGVAVAGAVALASEVMATSSIFFLGKQGFLELKAKLFALFKRPAKPKPVSQGRHRLGIACIMTNFVANYVAVCMVIVGFVRVTEADPFPIVWGLTFEQQGALFIGLVVGGAVLLFVGLGLLGDEWWDRFRALLHWQGERAAS
jgi:hypothetical protein